MLRLHLRLRVDQAERGEYACRWWVMRGTALGGKVEWEETWWESSDSSGMREIGAQKVGCNVSGDAWREAWKERVYHVADTGEPCVERSAHKWAKDENTGEQWEEKWGEFYAATGNINKWAEKWGKRGADVCTPLLLDLRTGICVEAVWPAAVIPWGPHDLSACRLLRKL